MFFSFRLILRGAAMAALNCFHYYRRDRLAFSIIKKRFFWFARIDALIRDEAG
jgi:hypothetical protein